MGKRQRRRIRDGLATRDEPLDQGDGTLVLMTSQDASMIWVAEALTELRDRYASMGYSGHADHVSRLLEIDVDYIHERVAQRAIPFDAIEDLEYELEARQDLALGDGTDEDPRDLFCDMDDPALDEAPARKELPASTSEG